MTTSRRQAAQNDVVGKLASVRALWFTVHNDPKKTIDEQAVEFYYLAGLLLEGQSFELLPFHHIDKTRALRQLKEG